MSQPKQLVIPVAKLDMTKLVFQEGKAQELFWKKLEDGSYYSPRFGHHYPAVIVEELPDGKFLHRGDTVVHEDGPCEPYGPANPSAVVVPYRLDVDGFVRIRGFSQYRPVIRHPVTGEMGVTTFSIPGGYDLAGEGPKAAALRHSIEEGGAILHEPKEVGAGTSNRMNIPTCIRIFVARYEDNPAGRVESAQGFERFLGDYEFRADKFPRELCFDLIVAGALMFAISYLGIIHPYIGTSILHE